MRHRLIRGVFSELLKASKIEKIVLILPFIVLILDADIFYFAWKNNEKNILIASGFVLLLSVLEIFAALKEIHEHVYALRRKEILEKRLRKIMKRIERPTVRKIVDKFMAEYPKEFDISEVYHVACGLIDEEEINLKKK
ncbi:MAG TPA: hypothetical protein ENG71_03605 [Thermoplasmatales archaeon]|nr:hypothetical protein [Thermoplasmatales archaeon]